MKNIILLFSIFISGHAFAKNEWMNRLYCYGTIFSGAEITVELKDAIDAQGLIRQVLFKKDIRSQAKVITNECYFEKDALLCENNKISIEITITDRKFHQGTSDSINYYYYDARVIRKTMLGTEKSYLRCHN